MQGGGTKGASGTLSVSTASELKTIDTGLSSISKFMLYMTSTKSGYEALNEAIYYNSEIPNKFYGVACYRVNSTGTQNYYDFKTTAESMFPAIKSINGGVIEIFNPSGGNWCVGNWTWVAVED